MSKVKPSEIIPNTAFNKVYIFSYEVFPTDVTAIFTAYKRLGSPTACRFFFSTLILMPSSLLGNTAMDEKTDKTKT